MMFDGKSICTYGPQNAHNGESSHEHTHIWEPSVCNSAMCAEGLCVGAQDE